jgi:hypothetical protein
MQNADYKMLESGHLKDQEGDGRIMLKWTQDKLTSHLAQFQFITSVNWM